MSHKALEMISAFWSVFGASTDCSSHLRKCIIGNGRADGLAQGIQLSELASRKGGFVDHTDISIANSR